MVKIERLFFAAAMGYMLATLCGCTGMQHGWTAERDCRAAAGPEPDAAADLLGMAGYTLAQQDPERAAWTRQVDDRFRARMAGR